MENYVKYELDDYLLLCLQTIIKKGVTMLKLIKKYRSDPRRTVVTLSCQKKLILNHLGDLMQKENRELINDFVNIEKCSCAVDRQAENYVLECSKCGEDKAKSNSLKEKKKQIEIEQAQILEKDNCQRAFRENYHIKPLEYDEKTSACKKNKALRAEKEMRGGIVCEKSFKILLCDLIAGALAVSLMICLVFKLAKGKRP